MENAYNRVCLRGSLASLPRLSHRGRDGDYYVFTLSVERLSHTFDEINVIARAALAEGLDALSGEKLEVCGEIRSFNNKSGVGSRLVITVFAKEILFCTGSDENEVELCGVICREPNYRRTPMGREICDLMLAVRRVYGRSDYLPCIAWGRTAAMAAAKSVGDAVRLKGRLQSRRYVKTGSDGTQERVAFEVSVMSMTDDELFNIGLHNAIGD